jgi:hypothetical protein
MRPSCRIPLRVNALFVALALFVIAGAEFAQEVPVQPPVAAPKQAVATPGNAVPPQWHDAVSHLADEIAADIRPVRALTLDVVENMSSIGPADAVLLSRLLETELTVRKIRVIQEALPETIVYLKISEGAEGPMLTADIRRHDEDSGPLIAIVALERRAASSSDEGRAPLIVQRKFVYMQAKPFLDFLVAGASGSEEARLVLLEPDHVEYLRFATAQWSVDHAFAVRPRSPASRDPRGLIAKDKDYDEAMHIYLPQETCLGSGHGQADLGCSPSVRAKPPAVLFMGHMWPLSPAEPRIFSAPYDPDRNYFEGLEASFGDFAGRLPAFYSGAVMSEGNRQSWILAELDGRARLYDGSPSATATFSGWGDNVVGVSADCDSAWLVLVSGTDDWTVRDTLRIYRVADHQAATVGQPLEFSGPILALWPADDGKSARVVSRNLQTGMYEASIVSVSCGN